ncbi:alpha/beta fold hydrolase [Geomicrobium sp. JCM 19038]|uniref:alpha/beta fold hydrolase n=1 Tax=Geomicrobium sp. JCM 19038 TaxID=1460635 RepID=UPI00045F4407|nr:alpha/beta hydrolase [Geomicrobium sp. JCM 19038]GAK10367.1 alpha/beta hydrolase fold [Geomicrobium sp. JCM 19038]
MFAQVNGTRLFFDVEGSSYVPEGPTMKKRPVCIAIHGGPGSDHSDFKPWLSPLQDTMQIIYVDLRNNGQSERVDLETCTMETMADDIEALRKYLGLDKVSVLGHSFGGMIAQILAVRHPQAIEKLLLINTAPSHHFYEDALAFAQQVATPRQLELIPKLFEGNLESEEAQVEWWAENYGLYFYHQDEKIMYETGHRPIESLGISNYTFKHIMPHYDYRDAITAIKAPVFIASGRHDWITPTSQSEIMNQLITNATLYVYEKSGHNPFIEEQELFLSDIRRFVTKED